MPEVVIEVLGPEPLCPRRSAALYIVNKVVNSLGFVEVLKWLRRISTLMTCWISMVL